MNRQRLTEILGSFLLGGAVVAMVYELSGRHVDAVTVAEAATAEGANDAEGDAPAGAIYAAGDDASAGEIAPPQAAAGDDDRPPWLRPDESGSYTAFPPIFAPPEPFDAAAEAEYPRHGLVTGAAVLIRERADLSSQIVGILRGGARVRTDRERSFGGGCSQGWHKVHPRGWICLNAGLTVGDAPPDDGVVNVPPPRVDEPMPYDYWRVNHDATPFFHRLPSFEEQDRADVAGQAWVAAHGREPMPTHPAQRPEEVPAVVKEYLNAGYYVTVAGEAVKSKRYFLRTLRGVYARKYQLESRQGSDFRGVVLGSADELPMYWIARETGMVKRKEPGSEILVDVPDLTAERRSRWPFRREIVIGTHHFYEDDDGNMMRAYAVAVARKIKRPPGVESSETWVHIDLSEQTLVAYDGDRPVFVTIVSTGKEEGMTPIGVHRLQSKHIATSMRDQPQEDDAYSIEDVPWTQYFHNNVALHGAFWHGAFGLVRSHGCVNLAPSDARWLFGFLGPKLPEGWHAASPGVAGLGPGSPVVITE